MIGFFTVNNSYVILMKWTNNPIIYFCLSCFNCNFNRVSTENTFIHLHPSQLYRAGEVQVKNCVVIYFVVWCRKSRESKAIPGIFLLS